jgi:Iap family predicted aminopeptidase
MNRKFATRIVGLVSVCAIPGSYAGDALAPEILARTLGPTPILADLAQLTDEIGGRPSGSAALSQAIAWGIEKFRAAGLENVHSESYTAPNLWVPGGESGEVTQPAKRSLGIAALPFSSATGPSGIEADVASVGHGEPADFAAAQGKLAGRWVLVETEPMRNIDDLDAEYLSTPRVFLAARQAGAVGVLWTSTRPGRLLYRHPVGLNDAIDPLPGAMLDREDALRIRRALARGQVVRVKIVTTPRIQTNIVLANVVGEIRGDGRQSESVVLGAHLDSWDLGQGALDNGCNVALVIDAARQMVIVSKKHRPARTIRFVLYTGEEAGFLGSRADARIHSANLDRTAAMITFDTGTGRTTGFSTGGRADVLAAADAALEPAVGLGPYKQTTDAFVGCDNYDYLVEGVPTFVANQDSEPYLPHYHASSDTYDKVDTRELKVNTAIAAVFTWELANAESAPGPRQSRSEIEDTLKTTELDKKMRAFGLWEDFLSGARGRAR